RAARVLLLGFGKDAPARRVALDAPKLEHGRVADEIEHARDDETRRTRGRFHGSDHVARTLAAALSPEAEGNTARADVGDGYRIEAPLGRGGEVAEHRGRGVRHGRAAARLLVGVHDGNGSLERADDIPEADLGRRPGEVVAAARAALRRE